MSDVPSAPILDAMDQASFLGLRALGHGPVNQFAWIYRRPADPAGLRDFHSHLAQGLLGRLVERSPLPFGRHRWVRAPAPPWEMIEAELSDELIVSWLDGLAWLPVDPEWGPGWRLLGRRLSGGGTIVVLLASHTIVDGVAHCRAIADAVTAIDPGVRYPPPHSRRLSAALREDAMTTMRSLPDVGRAVKAVATMPRETDGGSPGRQGRSGHVGRAQAFVDERAVVPSVVLIAPADRWAAHAAQSQGDLTSLVAAVAAGVAHRCGRTAPDGSVRLVLPVSLRASGPGDTRGNALTSIAVNVDPMLVDLGGLREAKRSALQQWTEYGDPMARALPLVPFIPRRLARRLESMALGPGQPVGVSHLGVVDPAVNRPDGDNADEVWGRSLEARSRGELRRLGGTLRVGSMVTRGQITVTIAGWQPGLVEARDVLADRVRDAADHLGLTYRLR